MRRARRLWEPRERRPGITSPVDQETCQHHWLIESPSGPTSVGQCKLCGAEREFRNSVGDSGWEKESPAERTLPRVVPVKPPDADGVTDDAGS